MDKGVVALRTLIEISKSLNILTRVIESSSENEGLVSELFATLKGELVGIWVKSSHWVANLDL